MTQAGQSKLRGLTSGYVVCAIAFGWMHCPSNSLEGKKGAGLGKCRSRDGAMGRPQLGLLGSLFLLPVPEELSGSFLG